MDTFAAKAPRRFSALGFPASIPKPRLRGLLQDFVGLTYLKGFKEIGAEHDFDHGHLLYSERTGEPMAILYHTQELSAYRGREPELDPLARNWIQWLDGRPAENASRYRRKSYPETPSWVWFKERELPRLERHRTITAKMLDPELLGEPVGRSMQWMFKRVHCSSLMDKEDSSLLDVNLPSGRVCLALSSNLSK